MRVETAQKAIEAAQRFAGHFMRLPDDSSVFIVDYDKALFGNEFVSAVTSKNSHEVRFNRLWIERGIEEYTDDILFFTFHELRHLYQRYEIERREKSEEHSESNQTLDIWSDNFNNYVFNCGDRESRRHNIEQEIEKDANGYALTLLRLFHIREDGWIPLIITPDVRLDEDVFESAVDRSEIYLARPEIAQHIDYCRKNKKPGRNDTCPCGSGQKFKKCCIGKHIFD